MSHNILHIVSGSRLDTTSVIVGDPAALINLRAAIDDALSSGSGGAALFSSDGEPHLVAVVAEDSMDQVYTAYAYEVAPERSRRETVPIDQLRNYGAALHKAAQSEPLSVSTSWTWAGGGVSQPSGPQP